MHPPEKKLIRIIVSWKNKKIPPYNNHLKINQTLF